MSGRNSFSQVKEDFPIGYFFQHYLDDEGSPNGTRYSACPACGSSTDNNKVSVRQNQFKCFKCGARGDVIEACALFFSCSKHEAVLKLTGNDRPTFTPKIVATPKVDRPALLCVIQAVLKVALPICSEVQEYLLGRGISLEVQQRAVDQGLLRSLPSTNATDNFQFLKGLCGVDQLEAAGLLTGEKRFAPASYRPLIFVSKDGQAMEFRLVREKTSAESKVIRYGLMSPFWFKSSQTRLLIVEGAMDLLSALELNGTSSIIGLPGASSWSIDWFESWAGKKVVLALDNDKAGQDAIHGYADPNGKHVLGIKEQLEAAGCSASIYSLPSGIKDLNEQLLASSHQ